jgi:DNA adenine methylase
MSQLQLPIRYFGGKGGMIDDLLFHFPPPNSYDTYIEPYGGSGVVLFSKPRAGVEVYNDLNLNVYTLYRVLQDETMFNSFKYKAELSIYHEQVMKDYIKSLRSGQLDTVERAFRFWYVNRTRRNGIGSFSVHSISRKNMSKSVRDFLASIEGLDAIHDRLRSVVITNRDALGMIPHWDRCRCLIYLDPPYVHSTRGDTRYETDADDSHQRELIEALSKVKNATIVLSGYNNDLYNSLGWRRADFNVNTIGGNRKTKTKTESVWLNFEEAKLI